MEINRSVSTVIVWATRFAAEAKLTIRYTFYVTKYCVRSGGRAHVSSGLINVLHSGSARESELFICKY